MGNTLGLLQQLGAVALPAHNGETPAHEVGRNRRRSSWQKESEMAVLVLMPTASQYTTCSTTWCVTFLVWEPNCAMTRERSGSSLTSTSIRKIFAFCMANRRRYRTAMKSPLSQRWQAGSGKVSR